MRRRRDRVVSRVPVPLRVESAPAPWVDDVALPAGARCERFDAWFVDFMAWRDARHEWAEANEWPGGIDAMLSEEPDVPNGPFDPARI